MKTPFNFSEALIQMKDGQKVRRKGWLKNDLYIFIEEKKVETIKIKVRTELGNFKIEFWHIMQIDILANDWVIADE